MVADSHIDVAASVCLYRHSEVADNDLGARGHLRSGNEIAPSTTMQQICGCLDNTGLGRGAQHDPREDTDLSCRAETGVCGDALLPSATLQEAVQHPVQAVLDTGGEEGPGLHGVSI